MDEKQFQQQVQQVGRLIAALDDVADAKARTAAQELVQCVMELHANAVEKMMEIIFAQGAAGADIIRQCAGDRVVSSLLVLHGLHPDLLETRVAQALQCLDAQLSQQGVEVQLLEARQEKVLLRAKTNSHVCGSTRAAVRSSLEEAVYEAAPEIALLVIEGLEDRNTGGFVSLEKLVNVPAHPAQAVEAAAGD